MNHPAIAEPGAGPWNAWGVETGWLVRPRRLSGFRQSKLSHLSKSTHFENGVLEATWITTASHADPRRQKFVLAAMGLAQTNGRPAGLAGRQ